MLNLRLSVKIFQGVNGIYNPPESFLDDFFTHPGSPRPGSLWYEFLNQSFPEHIGIVNQATNKILKGI